MSSASLFSQILWIGSALIPVLLPVTLNAQSGKEKVPEVSVRLLCYKRVGKQIHTGVYTPQGKVLNKGESVKLPLYQLSDAVKLPGRSFRWIPTEQANAPVWEPNTPAPDNAISVALPSTGNQWILLFVPSGKLEGPAYKIVPIAIPNDKFKGGSFLLINSTKESIGGRFGKVAVKIKPSSSFIVPSLKGDANQSSMGVLHSWESEKRAWSIRPFISIPLMPNPRKREVIILFKSPTNGKILFRGIQDLLNAPS